MSKKIGKNVYRSAGVLCLSIAAFFVSGCDSVFSSWLKGPPQWCSDQCAQKGNGLCRGGAEVFADKQKYCPNTGDQAACLDGEDMSQFAAINCEATPDNDKDKDGFQDTGDQCPNEAEDKDGFKDDDGCPDPDNDNDGIADANDQCPNEARGQYEDPARPGCPYAEPIGGACNKIESDPVVSDVVCVSRPSTFAMPVSFDQNSRALAPGGGIYVKANGPRVLVGIAVDGQGTISGNVDVCDAGGNCRPVPVANKTVYVVSPGGITTVRTRNATFSVRPAYWDVAAKAIVTPDPCPAQYMGEAGSCVLMP